MTGEVEIHGVPEPDKTWAARVASAQSQGALLLIWLLFFVHGTAIALVSALYVGDCYFLSQGAITPAQRLVDQEVIGWVLVTLSVEAIGVCAVAIGRFFAHRPSSA